MAKFYYNVRWKYGKVLLKCKVKYGKVLLKCKVKYGKVSIKRLEKNSPPPFSRIILS